MGKLSGSLCPCLGPTQTRLSAGIPWIEGQGLLEIGHALVGLFPLGQGCPPQPSGFVLRVSLQYGLEQAVRLLVIAPPRCLYPLLHEGSGK